ncbi:hypothetical protein GCM10023085_40460 [Actinomadura viridis]|uniref:Tetratricopeptide (TPR) repeat protein n=1 Tax=Actinomadura viridis TaxID=58110 RepID=A0A931GU20_9ACTN|nr:hypothetical protein [Actinomadura viridis]MBG6092674.1 tetratricopeptide (TPR) repeat protein [Actinomadura viridis]
MEKGERRMPERGRATSKSTPVAVETLAATLAAQRRADDLVGSQAVLPAACDHLAHILRLLQEARGDYTRRLAAVASEASQFAGWLHTATGAHDQAGSLYDQALRLGVQAGDHNLAATALSMRGHLAWTSGDYTEMAELSQAAAEMATAAGTRTVATQQRGRALALLGERQDALRAIGEAEEVLAKGTGRDDPDGLYFYGTELLAMQLGLILAYLARSPAEYLAAAEAIAGGIAAFPPALRDSEWVAWYRVQAAAALGMAGEAEEALTGLRKAFGVLSSTGGTKTIADIARVHRSLARRWPRHPDVASFGEALR